MKHTILLLLGIIISVSTIVNASTFGAGFSRRLSLPYLINQFKSTSAFCRPAYARNNRMAYSHVSNAIYSTATSNGSGERDDPPTVRALLLRAQKIRSKICRENSVPPTSLDSHHLSYPASAYDMEINNNVRNRNGKTSVRRGFCNWLLPQTIMIGQYPGMTPEVNGPSSKECLLHVQNMVQDANVSLFCCLQSEVPSQNDDVGWEGGKVYLTPESVRKEFPRPFARYGPSAQSFADSQLTFLHAPIEDLGVPTRSGTLSSLLSRLLGHLEEEGNRTMYLHCWGGRGRAGLVGSCLASLIFPELSPEEILDWVQRAYDSRLGARYMQEGLKRSPQTEQQRQFVRQFVSYVHAEDEETGKQ